MNQREHLWGLISGLMLGAGVFGHALRLVTIYDGGKPYSTTRIVVGVAGMVLYATATGLTWYRLKSGLWVAIIGPLVGLTAVVLFGGKSHVDLFQVVLGIPQFLAIFLSIYMLWLLRRNP